MSWFGLVVEFVLIFCVSFWIFQALAQRSRSRRAPEVPWGVAVAKMLEELEAKERLAVRSNVVYADWRNEPEYLWRYIMGNPQLRARVETLVCDFCGGSGEIIERMRCWHCEGTGWKVSYVYRAWL